MNHEKYMDRCLELAVKGLGNAAPNPLVGCVIVHDEKIIGEGFHRQFGGIHAEAEAIRSVANRVLLQESTLYVNLEPCAHFGKTPPCADLITENKIQRVVIGCIDSHQLVSGKGIDQLRESGCSVITGILEEKCRELNRRFFVFHEKKRPYIILKWARSLDGFIDKTRTGKQEKPQQISNELAKRLNHKWRSEEQAILVGTNTALLDDPRLNVREWEGKNPLRITIDRNLVLPANLRLLDGSQPTLIFTRKNNAAKPNIEYRTLEKGDEIGQILGHLHDLEIQSVIVEGGARLLSAFLDSGSWDEARVFIGGQMLHDGVKSPRFPDQPYQKQAIGNNELLIFRNG